ncbi:hypothetical protein ID866_9799 [Astraeus odoratus]|nr:hypothetical protein ID866_9799 [Astraeus odoratus]
MGKLDHIPELTGASTFFACEGSDPLDLAEFASALLSPVDASNPTAEERKLILEWLKEDAVAKDILSKSSLGQSSLISALLSTAGTTFEAVSVRIAVEAHCLLLESTSAAPVGSEYANVPGGGMASQQLAHWNRHKPLTTNPSLPSTVTPAAPGTNTQVMTAASTAVPPPAAPATTAAVFCPTWGSNLEDLACPTFSTVGSPSSAVLNSLVRPSLLGNSLLDSGTSQMLVCDHVYFQSYQEGGGVNMCTANHRTLPTAGVGDCMAYLTVGESCYHVHFTACLYALDAALNLISVTWKGAPGGESLLPPP